MIRMLSRCEGVAGSATHKPGEPQHTVQFIRIACGREAGDTISERLQRIGRAFHALNVLELA
jgi:hypothetical protein